MKAIRVLLVDDQPSVRRGLRMRLQLEPDITVVGEAADAAEALAAARELQPDVLVVDYELPDMNGVEAVHALSASGLAFPVVLLTIHDNPSVRQQAASTGVMAFVAKHEPGENLLKAIRRSARSPSTEEDTS